MKARVTSTLVSSWLPSTERKLDLAVLEMATDIHRRSAILAPVDTRALVNSGRIIRRDKGKYSVAYGGGRVKYAKRRHYENKKNPQTLKYLERAGTSVSRSLNRYIGKI